jgi:hypothetical protein
VHRIIAVELIPKSLIVGVFTPPPGVPGSQAVTADRLNRIWSEVAPNHGYRHLQLAPDESGAVFVGADPEVGVTIQPPLLQVRDSIVLTASQSAERAESVLKVIARHLGTSQFFNLGIRHVYHAATPENDAHAFVLHRLLRYTEDDLGDLTVGGQVTGGAKFIASGTDVNYTLVIEPLLRDPRYLFLDLDAQFAGPVELDRVTPRAKDAESYLTQAVNRFLDSVAGS